MLETALLKAAFGAVNTFGFLAGRAGASLVPLDVQALIDAARRRTGLADFGQPVFGEPLRVLINAYDREARLSLVGRLSTHWDTLRLLGNRLLLERDWQRYAQIGEESVVRPLFITGLPRSGTTLLHNLLAQDPQLRFPTHWEVMSPSPPPGPTAKDTRANEVERRLRWFFRVVPEFRAIHPIGAQSPQECTEITAHVFTSLRFDTLYEVPSYTQWLDDNGQYGAYRFHYRFLQHLQWGATQRRWVLKSPDHVFALNELLTTYPDAGIIVTHRDPLRVLPSVASLTATLQRPYSDHVDLAAIGEKVSTRWALGAQHIIAAKSKHPNPSQYLDVKYLDLARNPVETVRRIYRHFDLPLSDETLARMQRFLADNPKNKNGLHRYSLQQYALDPERERRRYRDYIDHFGIESEPFE